MSARAFVLILVALIPVAAAIGVGAPEGTVGDTFAYRVTSTISSTGEANLTGELKVAAIEPLTLEDGVTTDALRLEGRFEGPAVVSNIGGRAFINVTLHARATDGAYMKRMIVTTFQPAGFPAQVQREETVWRAPCAQYAWPLEVEASWNVECELTKTKSQTGLFSTPATTTQERTNTTWTVLGEENVTTPAGALRVLVIQRNETGPSGSFVGTDHYASDACTFARREERSASQTTTYQLQSFQCAKPWTPPPELTPGTDDQDDQRMPLGIVLAIAALAAVALARRR